MYDNVSFSLDRTDIANQYDALVKYIDNVRVTELNNKEVVHCGYVGNMKVSLLVGRVYIRGSLPKFLFGNNFQMLNGGTTREVISKLSDTLHLDMSKARVTGLEYGFNFIVEDEVSAYLSRLGNMPRKARCLYCDTTLYYHGRGKNRPQEYCFYDKAKEMESKAVDIPSSFKGHNILRYEMRLKGRLASTFKVPMVLASTLTEGEFRMKLYNEYLRRFEMIEKNTDIEEDKHVRTPREAAGYFFAKNATEEMRNGIQSFIDSLKAKHIFKSGRDYTRTAKIITEMLELKGREDDHIRELREHIKNANK